MIKNKKMEKEYNIKQEPEKCIGCGACVSLCPSNWEFKKDGKAYPKKTKITEREYKCNKRAEDSCPVQCIKIK